VTKPFKVYGEEIEAEAAAAEATRAAERERRLTYAVGFWAGRYDRCRQHARALEEQVSQLSMRPPLDAPIWRRLRYLFTGR